MPLKFAAGVNVTCPSPLSTTVPLARLRHARDGQRVAVHVGVVAQQLRLRDIAVSSSVVAASSTATGASFTAVT